MTRKALNLAGKKFGRLLAVRIVGRDKYNRMLWLCKCDCGSSTIYSSNSLVSSGKLSTSCGCAFLKRKSYAGINNPNYKHGRTTADTVKGEYSSWYNMKTRCFYEKSTDYPNYGGRGITVCERWLDFSNFYEDMGPRPGGKDEYELDRKDPNGNYEPNNCQWIIRNTGKKRKKIKRIRLYD